jgi:phospholipid/cholesterol/gamma-HCH transport system substrate-binding protein
MDKLDRLVNEKTINGFHSSIKNLDEVSNKLNLMMPRIEHFINNSIEWEDKISFNFQTIMQSYMGIRESMDLFKASLARGDFNFKDITSDIIPTLNSTASEVQQLVIRLDALVEQYEKSPGDILYKTQEIKKGPGE